MTSPQHGSASIGNSDVAAPAAPKGIFRRAILQTTEGRIGLLLAVLVGITIVVGPWIAPYSPSQIGFLPNQGPSPENLLGTDSLGRDVLSRFLTGGRSIVVLPVIAVTLATGIGGFLGMLSAYKGGAVDALFVRFIDLMLALPALLMVLVLIAGFGKSDTVIVAAIAILFAPRSARMIRGVAQNIVKQDYVAAAQARGERTPSILLREVLPNIAGPGIAEYALRLTWGVVFVSTLSFIGLGQQPPSSDWGLMVAQNRVSLSLAPLGTIVPAIGIAFIAISLNLIADAVTKTLDPSAKNSGAPV